MKIDAGDKSLSDILTGAYYRIPRFQRPYSWTIDNVADLWTDSIEHEGGDYFIGSMVVYREGKDNFGVVDGQQRLTTITMLLATLRDAFDLEGHADLAQGIQQLIERKNIDNASQFVLATETSYPYFQEHIQKFGTPDAGAVTGAEEAALQTAHKEIQRLVRGAVESVKIDTTANEEVKVKNVRSKLVQIRDKILSLKLIFVVLDSEDDAYTIFETLNTRGKDLSVADLVKNHFVKNIRVKTKGVDPAVFKWHKLQETLEGSSADLPLDGFLHHFWLSAFDYVTLKTLFREFRKKVASKNASEFLDRLQKEAIIYRQIHEITYRKWQQAELSIRQSLEALQLFKVKQQVPMVQSVMRDYSDDKLKQKDVKRALTPIANFHFIFTAVTSQRSSGGISQMYAKSARELHSTDDREDKLAIVDALVLKLRERCPNEAEFKANFRQILYTNAQAKQRPLVRFILNRIDESLRTDAIVEYSQMTIEHLAPQSPPGGQTLTEAVYGQIGNLILVPLALNNSLGNKPISEKIEMLKKAGVPLDGSILGAGQWGAAEIEKRTDELASLCHSKLFAI